MLSLQSSHQDFCQPWKYCLPLWTGICLEIFVAEAKWILYKLQEFLNPNYCKSFMWLKKPVPCVRLFLLLPCIVDTSVMSLIFTFFVEDNSSENSSKEFNFDLSDKWEVSASTRSYSYWFFWCFLLFVFFFFNECSIHFYNPSNWKHRARKISSA